MNRRRFLFSLTPALLLAGEQRSSLRGTLLQQNGKPPSLKLPSGAEISLQGDRSTESVLRDSRLAGFDFEVMGNQVSPEMFRVDPIHTKAMFVHKDGNRLMISYWCAVCAIRTYAPGPCMCCQDETELDLKESFEP